MRFSQKLERIPPYLFAKIDREIARKREEGIDVISFGVGDPDMPTHEPIVDTLCRASRDPVNHRYPSYFGLEEFRNTVSEWFGERFGVAMDPDSQVLPLLGSKEGIAHLPVAILDPGDTALVPEPSYPVYQMGTLLAGGNVCFMPLESENGFLPSFKNIGQDDIESAKLLWLNYPNNPTGAVADIDFFARAVDFANEHGIIVAHDNAYSEITYDGFVAPSLLEVDGAMETAVEFHSLSKTFNMTGMRIGFACGNSGVIEALGTVKTNIDSGIFNPIQLAGITALRETMEYTREMVRLYRSRREFMVEGLRALGWDANPPRGGIYIWMRVPEGYDSIGFSTYVLEEAGVFFTPGNAYGASGEGFVRISLTVPDKRMREAVSRLKEVFIS